MYGFRQKFKKKTYNSLSVGYNCWCLL